MNTKNNIIHSHGKYCVPTNVLMYKRSYYDYSKNGRGKEVFFCYILRPFILSLFTRYLTSLSYIATLRVQALITTVSLPLTEILSQ